MSRIFFALAFLLLAGCASVTERGADRTARQSPGIRLPGPSDLHGASFIPGDRDLEAALYEVTLPDNRVQVVGNSLQFTADSALGDISDMAYAMYLIDVGAYAGLGLLTIDWQGAAPNSGVYVGLSNWTANRWDWMETPLAESADLGIYSDYLHPITNRLIVTVLSTRIQTMTLDRVAFGTPGLEPPTNVQATDGDFPDKVAVTWDAPAGGPSPNGYSIWRSDDVMPRTYAEIDTVAFVTNYEDTTVLSDTKYWYKVKSTKPSEVDSPLSDENDGIATAGGAGWTVVTASVFGGQDPQQLSLGLVGTNPAISYGRITAAYPIYYTRAQDSAGATWGGVLSNLDATSQEPNLGYFNSVPCVSAAGTSANPDVKFRHGSEGTGDQAWDPWITAFNSASQHVASDPDLLTVQGRPAMAFRYADFENFTGTELCYIRATDAAGDNWPATRKVVDSGERAWNPQMILLASGNPAILYSETDNQGTDDADLLYAYSTDITGVAWAPAEKVYDFAGANDLPQLQLILANGVPAAVFEDPPTGHLYYKRASNADGSTWPAGATKIADATDFYNGATTVNGKPAVAYIADGGSDIMYLEAIDDSGNSWLPAALVEDQPGGAGLATMMALGSPTQHACIAFRVDGAEIRFARKN